LTNSFAISSDQVAVISTQRGQIELPAMIPNGFKSSQDCRMSGELLTLILYLRGGPKGVEDPKPGCIGFDPKPPPCARFPKLLTPKEGTALPKEGAPDVTPGGEASVLKLIPVPNDENETWPKPPLPMVLGAPKV
jgi:hypothetical protein